MPAPDTFFDVKFEGFEQVERAFRELPLYLQRKMLRPSMRDGAKLLRDHVAAVAPRSTDKSEGGGGGAPHMADNIRIKAMKRSRAGGGRIGFVVITGKRDEIGQKGDGYFPVHLELGRLAGPRVQGPVDFDETQRGEKGQFVKKGRTKRDAERELQAGRRKIPGTHWMRSALRSGEAAARVRIAESLERRMMAAAGDDLSKPQFYADADAEFEESTVFGGGTGL